MYATVPAGSEAAPGVGPVLGVLSGCSWLSPKSDTFAVKLRWSSCGAQLFSGIHARRKVLLALHYSLGRGCQGVGRQHLYTQTCTHIRPVSRYCRRDMTQKRGLELTGQEDSSTFFGFRSLCTTRMLCK